MTAVAVLVFVVLGVAVVLFFVSTATFVFGSVDRKRLERFALRQALFITPGNGNVVIRYLATTRRWRGGLLYLAVLVSYGWVTVGTHNQQDVNLLGVFCGWFVGAVIAEWRVDSLARGPGAVALLHRRRIADYVRQRVLVPAALLWSAVPVLAVIAVAVTLRRSANQLSAAATLCAGLLVGSAILLVVRRILQRPQPMVAPDLLEADNAIRGRSLNVLMGCALAIGGYLGSVSLDEIVVPSDAGAVGLAHLFGFAALPILGVLVARTPRRTPLAPAAVLFAA